MAGDEFTGRLFVCTKFFRSAGGESEMGLVVGLVLGCPGSRVRDRINGEE